MCKGVLSTSSRITHHLAYCSIPDEPFAGSYSQAILDKDGHLLRVFLNDNQQWCFPPVSHTPVPYKLKKAVLHYEDRYFHYHPGVNPVSILRALYQNISSGEITSGGSTLTMQLARLMEPKRRSYLNKIIEMVQAVKIELRYSKSDILRMYLEHAPYGRNIIGYRAASLKYFEKLPERLTWSEAALLAVLPNSPNLLSPPVSSKTLIKKRNRLLKKLHNEEIITKETYELSLLESIPEEAAPFEMHAPHLCRMIHNSSRKNEPIISTTIDINIQKMTRNIVKQHSLELSRKGIKNIAAIVADTQTGKIRAYIGSQDYYDTDAEGCVDGVMAPRSTGSTLKPFLYALSIDSGAVIPQTMIKDIPSFYSGFSPENASGKFDGLVTARAALIRSLNVPAVRLLNYYGLEDFYDFLKKAGLHNLYGSPFHYGLPLIIGGVEANLLDMTALYRGLGNMGKFGSLSYYQDIQGKSSSGQRRLISKGAGYLILNILKDVKRPGAEYYWQSYQNQWPIAWKTGTSYGKRDAWAMGVTPQWTIGVWVGNFTGKGNGELSGASCAGPILFDIFNSLEKDPLLSWFDKPYEDLNEIQLCADTGFRAGPDCINTITAEVPEFMKPLRKCPYHKSIFTTMDEKHEVCSLCWEPGNYKKVSRLFLSPDVVQYLRDRGVNMSNIPPHNKDCPQISGNNPLDIIYPTSKARLWIPRDFNRQRQKLTLRAAHREDGKKIFWYIDHQFKATTQENHVIALNLENGWHNLEIVDENGNRKNRRFFVAVNR